ncbi:MAG: thiamine-phosphate pyrophosphorylase [Candidatus Omnitrophica bacterium]|nr:thiamine-phosphate pyrophosphorylase [Candidatus Omnitrophota bacterium]
MRKPARNRQIDRILDANINRVKEGLRVSEEIARFILNSPVLTSQFKRLRHRVDIILEDVPRAREFIHKRCSNRDAGRNVEESEFNRRDTEHVFRANMQRVKESLRVLEEFMKLESESAARSFKKERYRMYEIEKSAARKIQALRHT